MGILRSAEKLFHFFGTFTVRAVYVIMAVMAVVGTWQFQAMRYEQPDNHVSGTAVLFNLLVMGLALRVVRSMRDLHVEVRESESTLDDKWYYALAVLVGSALAGLILVLLRADWAGWCIDKLNSLLEFLTGLVGTSWQISVTGEEVVTATWASVVVFAVFIIALLNYHHQYRMSSRSRRGSSRSRRMPRLKLPSRKKQDAPRGEPVRTGPARTVSPGPAPQQPTEERARLDELLQRSGGFQD